LGSCQRLMKVEGKVLREGAGAQADLSFPPWSFPTRTSDLAPYHSCNDGWSNWYYRHEPVMVDQDKIYGQSSSRRLGEGGATKLTFASPPSLLSPSPDVRLGLLRVPNHHDYLSNILASCPLRFHHALDPVHQGRRDQAVSSHPRRDSDYLPDGGSPGLLQGSDAESDGC
jgi:hypothetical protein